jgi:hypothetical protein
MLDAQEAFEKMLYGGVAPKDLPLTEKLKFIFDLNYACEDELHEAMNETSWKPWAKGEFIHEEEFKGELIDAWHFMMCLFLSVGMDSAEIHQRYAIKLTRNIQRQQGDGYDAHANKCPTCHRDFDDLRSAQGVAFEQYYHNERVYCSKRCALTIDEGDDRVEP